MGRKARQQIATAYDMRRCKTLVDILAAGDERALVMLAEKWGVLRDAHLEPTHYVAARLAQHAQEHFRQQIREREGNDGQITL